MPDLLHRFESLIAERYEVERELGHGGMAVVYLARDVRHSRSVAIKVMRPEIALSLGTERFLREIRIAAGLHHPNILALFDSGQTDGLLYFVMPYVAGETLRARLEREQQLRTEDALSITRQVASALDYAHAQGVVHRDIKPENILLTDNRVCVADFGLARAVTTAAGERLTDSGIAMGTPAYMSPEQASADREVGARSDIYSLGCVVYEMFAGIPPFSGPNVQTIAMRHMTDTASPLRRLRPSTPEAVEAAVAKALEKVPADRFETAGQLSAAMEAPAPPPLQAIPTGPTWPPARPRRRETWWIVLVVALVGAALVLALARPMLTRIRTSSSPALDDSRYAVLPFESGSGSPPELNGIQVSSRLRDALAQWRDLNQVGELQINEALGEGASPHLSRSEALDMARRLSAGRLVWGRVLRRGDSLLVDAALYDVRRERIIREKRVSLAPDVHDLPAQMTALGTSLLLGEGTAESAAGRQVGSASFSAVTAVDSGVRALRSWSLDAAESHFRMATELDPSYPKAHLWLAQILAWSDRAPVLARRSTARRAFELRGRLTARDSILSEGLLALADSRFPDACRHFDALVHRDSTDFAAWLGAGDCRGNDAVVLPDPRSPSRWSFRGGSQRGVDAYVQALLLVPSASRAFALRRLRRLLITEPARPRPGFALSGSDTLEFLGFPSLDHDTLAYVPYRATDVAPSRRSDPTLAAAISHNRGILRDVASSWVRAYPASADAHESLADALESTGELSTASSGGVSALQAIQKARSLSSDSTQRIRLTVSEVRVQLKLGQFETARRVADSMLTALPRGSHDALGYSASLSALTGRAHQAAGLMRSLGAAAPIGTAAGKILSPQSQLGGEAQALLTYASLGAPTDSIRAIARRVDRLLGSSLGTTDAVRARFGFVGRPLSLSVPVLGPAIMLRERASGDYLASMQRLLARHDTTGLRAAFDTLALSRTGTLPNDVTADAIYQEAWLLLAMGDSAGAIGRLDGSLGTLPSLSARVLEQVSTAAAIVRSMALRADLAAATRDRQTARRWAGAVIALWGGADAEFAPLLARMRQIAL